MKYSLSFNCFFVEFGLRVAVQDCGMAASVDLG
jgi:hypothetical protein